MTATHPTDRELSDFLLGKLADSHFGEVESHLAECPECGRRALAAPADDTLTDLLAAARTRLDSQRASAPTPTLDAAATPSLAAPTLTWGGSAPGPDGQAEAPVVLANHPKYRVIRRLGTGGMGTVWLAEHQVMHRPVAIKVIRPDLLARPGATDRFLREVRAVSKLHHPNIVTAFDAEPVGDSCLLVMEFVDGQTLGERLERGSLPVAEAVRAVRDAARGLAHAHSHGLVHRDIKPHNLIRSADGTTKVLDFGLAGVGAGEGPAASDDGLTGAGMVVGTPDYIAPEQIVDPHAADARADIYGLGCTLYHLLAGRPPLPAGSVAEKLAAQPTHEPDLIPDLPPGLAAVLAKMMAKRPEDRYQTADELIAALEPFSGIPVSRNAKAERARRPPLWLALAAGVLLLTAAGVVFKIERDNQIITVSTDDPDIEVVMKRKGEVLRVIDKKTGQEWEIDTAKNEIARADRADGLTLTLPDNREIILKRNGKDVFRVARVTKGPAADDRQAKIDAATKAAEAWLKLFDAGDYGRAWDEGGARMHEALGREDTIREFQAMAQRTGKPLARSTVRRQYATATRGRPDGEHVVIHYRTDYERAKGVDELMTVTLQPDGRWRVGSYGSQITGRGGPAATAPAPKLRQTIEEERRFPQTPSFTPDGKILLVAGYDYFAMYVPATGKELFSDQFGGGETYTHLAVSADGRSAAVACGDAFLYDLAARKRVATFPRPEADGRLLAVGALTLSPDGQKLAYVAGPEVVYYDRATGQTEHTRPDDDKVRVFDLRYSPDGRYLAVASRVEADQSTRVSLLDAKTRVLVGRHETTSLSGATLQFSSDGRQLFVAGTGLVRRTFLVVGVPSAKEVERDPDLPSGPETPVPSPDGRLLALTGADGTVQVWDRGQKRVAFAWNPHTHTPPEFRPPPGRKAAPPRTGIAFSPDGRTLATARGNQIRVWDLVPAPPSGKN